jgi:transposase
MIESGGLALPCLFAFLEKEITELTTQLAPALLQLPGCGALTAAKIIGETAGVGLAWFPPPRHGGECRHRLG